MSTSLPATRGSAHADQYPTAPKGSAFAKVFETLSEVGSEYAGADSKGGRFVCPLHDDAHASLEVHYGDLAGGIPLVSCPPCEARVGRSAFEDALLIAGVRWSGKKVPNPDDIDWGDPATALAKPGGGRRRKRALFETHTVAETYTYRKADGSVNFEVKRWEPRPEFADTLRKQFTPQRIVLGEGRVCNLDGVERTPYRLERFEKWAGRTVYLVEGEKAADALRAAKRRATTFANGGRFAPAKGWAERYGFTAFREVRLWPDADEVGVVWARHRAGELRAAGVKVSFWGVPAEHVEPSDDAYDVIERGQTGEVRELSDAEVDQLAAKKPATKAKKPATRGLKPVVSAQRYDPVAEAEALLGESESAPDDPLADDESTEFKDARLAYRFADEFTRRGKPVIYTSGLGWLCWTGKHWRPTDAATIRGKVMDFALDWLRDLAGTKGTKDTRDKVAALLTDSRAQKVVNAMQALVRAEATDFDRHDDLLNCQNGVVDLRTGRLRPHDPALLLTKVTRVAYKPEVGGEVADWEKAKQGLSPEVLDYLLDRLGQACTGYTPSDDKILFNSGSGGNGKSTLLEPVRLCLGDYADMVPQKLLLANPNEHPTELMTLRGLRLALIEELPEASRLNTQRLKTITGTEAITGRLMYKNFVTFAPTHALLVNTNHEPNVIETDHGTWRRLEKIAFDRKYRAEDGSVDEALRQRVKRRAVQEAALADLVAHAQRWYDHDRIMPRPPSAVAEATQKWRVDSDDVLAFFNDRLEPDMHADVSMADVLDEFNSWLADKGGNRTGWGDKLLTARLTTNESLPVPFEKRRSRKHVLPNGFTTSEKSAVYVWRGVKFRR